MKRLSFVCGSLATLLLSASLAAQAPAAAQGGAAPPALAKNLQVLDKNQTTAQVIVFMRTFAAALGTECGHCHVWFGAGNAMNDFPSDVKPEKAKARVMLRMVMDINKTISTEFTKLGKPANEQVQVQCVTCHRGQIIPKQLVDIVADTASQSNAAAAVAKYRDLRKEFYGSQSYDFSDTTLFDAATRAVAANEVRRCHSVYADESRVQPEVGAQPSGDVAGVSAQGRHAQRDRRNGKSRRARSGAAASAE